MNYANGDSGSGKVLLL